MSRKSFGTMLLANRRARNKPEKPVKMHILEGRIVAAEYPDIPPTTDLRVGPPPNLVPRGAKLG